MKEIYSIFVKFLDLSQMQRRTLISALLLLPVFWLALRMLGLARFHANLKRRPILATVLVPISVIRTVGLAVNIAARHTPFPATCLTRSLLLGWLLRRRGVPSDLRIGVRLAKGVLDAHAWVECGGVPVNDSLDVGSQFAAFSDLVPSKASSAS